MKKLLFTLCLFTLLACGGDDNAEMEMEDPCHTEVQYAFRITVHNTVDDSLLEGVTITAREQMFEEVLTVESPGVYVGLEERPGNYQLIIEKEDFQTIIASETSMDENVCGLITKTLNFELEPI